MIRKPVELLSEYFHGFNWERLFSAENNKNMPGIMIILNVNQMVIIT